LRSLPSEEAPRPFSTDIGTEPSGAAHLLYSRIDALASEDIENLLRLAADDIPPANELPTSTNYPPTPSDSLTGAGRLNIYRALKLLEAPNWIYGVPILSVPWTELNPTFVTTYGPTTVFGVPELTDSIYSNIEQHELTYNFSFASKGLSFSRPPVVWGQGGGQRTTGWLDYRGSSRLMTDWRHCFVTDVTRFGCKIHTYVYKFVPIGWFPAGEGDLFNFTITILDPAPVPDPARSFYVPQAIEGGTTLVEGSQAYKYFHTCPNNDGGTSLPENARVKVVVRDAVNTGIPDISSGDIFLLLNGGTAVQGFVGDGADSVIANSQWNQSPLCPDLRVLTADGPTDETGTTYITFTGAGGTRAGSRKWGHYDSRLPVYVLGTEIQGRLTSDPGSPGYTLRIKNYDVSGGLGATMNQGEAVTSTDYNTMVANLNKSNVITYWLDYNESGTVTTLDYNMLLAHINHNCIFPYNP
jgi:hypothetical protein